MNKILLKACDKSSMIDELLDLSSVREPVFDAEKGFLWIKDKQGNKLKIAGPRATQSFYFKGIVSQQISSYPGNICDVGDILFIQVESTIDNNVIPAGSLIVKVADTEDGVGSWYTFEKITQSSLKIESSKLQSKSLITALEELSDKFPEIDNTNLEISTENKLKLKDNVSILNLSATGDSTGPKKEFTTPIGTVSASKTIFLLFKKDLQNTTTHISGDIFEKSDTSFSHSKISLNALGSKSFSSVSSSPLGRTALITCYYNGLIWYGLQFPPQNSSLYFSGWRNIDVELAPPDQQLYNDLDISNISILNETDNGNGLSITENINKKSVSIGDDFTFNFPVSNSSLDYVGQQNGSSYYDSELSSLMIFDSVRNKWISSNKLVLQFGADSVDGQYLTINGVQSSLSGFLLNKNCTLLSLAIKAGSGELNKDFEIRLDGSSVPIYSFSLVNGVFSSAALNIDINALSFIQVFASAVGDKSDFVVATLELAYTK